MTAQRKELTTTPFQFVTTTLKEAQEYATIFANSDLCPSGFKGRPNDILVVWQTGYELGLGKMQSLRILGCINGRTFAYGDGQLALIRKHRDFVDIKEWMEGQMNDGTMTAYCTIKRRNQEPVTRSFSIEDAKVAGLWGKVGPWQQYKKRMLQHKARTYACRDTFADALYGLLSEQEAIEIVEQEKVEVKTVPNKGMKGLEESLGINKEEPVIEVEVVEAEELNEKETLLSELNQLIIDKNITQKVRDKWCKQFNVNVIDDLPVDNMKNIIKYYKEQK